MEKENLLIEINSKLDALTIQHKEILTAAEAAAFMGMRLKGLYRLTHENLIPYYKPNGKTMYFKKADLQAYMLSNRIKPSREIDSTAATYNAVK